MASRTAVPASKKYAKRGPNEAMLKLLRDEVDRLKTSRGSQYMEANLKKAIKELEKYPLPLKNGKAAMVIRGIGEKIAELIDNSLPRYLAAQEEEESHDPEYKLYKARTKIIPTLEKEASQFDDPFDIFSDPLIRQIQQTQAEKTSNFFQEDEEDLELPMEIRRRRGIVSNANATPGQMAAQAAIRRHDEVPGGGLEPQRPVPIDDSDVLNRMFNPNKRKKPYVPKLKTGNWAILVALLKHVPENQSLEEPSLRHYAERYSSEPMWSDPNSRNALYNAFSGINKLIQEGWVLKQMRPKRYSLTPTGRQMAIKLWEEQGIHEFGDNPLEVSHQNLLNRHLEDDEDDEIQNQNHSTTTTTTTATTNPKKRSRSQAKMTAAQMRAAQSASNQPDWRYQNTSNQTNQTSSHQTSHTNSNLASNQNDMYPFTNTIPTSLLDERTRRPKSTSNSLSFVDPSEPFIGSSAYTSSIQTSSQNKSNDPSSSNSRALYSSEINIIDSDDEFEYPPTKYSQPLSQTTDSQKYHPGNTSYLSQPDLRRSNSTVIENNSQGNHTPTVLSRSNSLHQNQLPEYQLSRQTSETIRARTGVAEPDFLKKMKKVALSQTTLNVPFTAHTITKIVVIVDNREKRLSLKEFNQDYFQNALADMGCTVRTRPMVLGDFMWIGVTDTMQEVVLDAIVERKTVPDLAASIIDTRFEEQKWRLRHSGLSKVCYLVEGPIDPQSPAAAKSDVPYDRLLTALSNTEFLDLITVLRTKDYRDTVAMIFAIGKWLEAKYLNKRVFTASPVFTASMKVRHFGITDTERYENLLIDNLDLLCWTYTQFEAHSEKFPPLPQPDTWAKQLLCCKGMSPQRVSAIINKYDTSQKLLEAYFETPRFADRVKLIANIEFEGRRIGEALGTLIHDALWGDRS